MSSRVCDSLLVAIIVAVFCSAPAFPLSAFPLDLSLELLSPRAAMADTIEASPREALNLETSVERIDIKLRVEDLELMTVVCAKADKKSTGALIAILNSDLPLPMLKYLKRVKSRKGDATNLVLVGRRSDVDGMPAQSLQAVRELCVDSELTEAEVPAIVPRTREQFDQWSNIWPLNYRPPPGGMKALSAFSGQGPPPS